jgi:BACON domain-containing protein/peptidase M66-like protein
MQALRLFSGVFQIVLISMLASACGSGSSSGSSTPAVATPPPPATAPEISGLSPTSLTFDLNENESANGSLSFSNSGDAALTFELQTTAGWVAISTPQSGSLAPGGSTNVNVSVTCGPEDLSSTLSLTTNDADEASVSVPVELSCTPLTQDVAVDRVLLNQGARAFDSELSDTPAIDIVAGRELLVRAFVTGTGVPPEARVVVQRPGQVAASFNMQTPPSIGDSPADESILSASHYVILPENVVSEGMTLQIEVAPFSNPVTYPASGSLDPDVSALSPLRVTFVPVTFNGETPDLNSADYMREALQVLPIGDVDIDIRTPYVYTGAYDLEDLLMEISDLRDLDGSDRLYHGVIVPPGGSNATTAGVGFVGYPVSVSIDLGGAAYVIAHEMGHNLNLGHAPGCDAPGADADYPYADAAVTTWGYDVTQNTLVEPTDTKRDFMSYCQDLWVSDYHFSRALQHRLGSPIGFGPPVPQGLLLSGRLSNTGLSRFSALPVARYHPMAALGERQDTYQFRAWDAQGVEVVNHEFERLTIEDVEASHAFSFRVPMPLSDIDHFEIRSADTVLVSQRFPDTAGQADVILQVSPQADQVTYHWDNAVHQALVLRNTAGDVIAVNRTGSFALPDRLAREQVTAALAGWGNVGAATPVWSDTNRSIQLAR